MAYRVGYYTEEAHLQELGREHLDRLFAHYERALSRDGVRIPETEDDGRYFRDIAMLFMSPEGIPREIHEALYHIRELNNEVGDDRLVGAVHAGRLRTVDLRAELSTADRLLLAWIENEPLVRELLIQAGLDRSTSFTTFPSNPSGEMEMAVIATVLGDLQDAVGELCSRKGRQQWAEIQHLTRGQEEVFVIKRTDPFRRTTRHESGGERPDYHWPVQQDLVVYHRGERNLRTNVTGGWLQKGYRELFGTYLFGDVELFQVGASVDLRPILWRGRGCLEGDAFGIDRIRLTELQTRVDPETPDYRIRRSPDVFASYEAEGGLPVEEEIVKAVFKVRMRGARHERTVSITQPDRAKYTQDPQGERVKEWMQAMGFSFVREDVAA